MELNDSQTPTIYIAPRSSSSSKRQVYSNRPLRVYGFIEQLAKHEYHVLIGDPYHSVETGHVYPTLAAAKKAIVNHYFSEGASLL